MIWRSKPSLSAAYDYYPFGTLMPGRCLDTAVLCVTSPSYTEIPPYHSASGGQLSSSGGGGAKAVGSAVLSNLSGGGISATGTSGGFKYSITGIPAAYISLQLNFIYLSGASTAAFCWLITVVRTS